MKIEHRKLSQVLSTFPRLLLLVGLLACLSVGFVHAQQPTEVIAVGENKVAQVAPGVPFNFGFSATAGQTVTIQALAVTPGLAPTFGVLDQNAVLIQNVDNPLMQSTVSGVVTFEQAGNYVIAVAAQNGVAGQVLVSITEGGTPPPPPTPLTVGQNIQDILEPNATIVYSFSGDPDPNMGLRVLFNSLDPVRGLSVSLTTLDGRLLATTSNELVEQIVTIPPNPPGSYLLKLTNNHPAAVTISYSLTLNQVNFAAPTPTTIPATLIPLPTTGGCVLATLGQFVNLRQGPSTSAAIITTIFPNVVYNVIGRNEDTTWYQIGVPEGTGWVSVAVIRTGGDCSAVPVVSTQPTATSVPVTTSTATATTEATSETTPEATEPVEVTTEPTAEETPTVEATEAATP